MKKCLVIPYGFLGDILHASSVAPKLLKECNFDSVDFLISWPQVYHMLSYDPNISNVYYAKAEKPKDEYDSVFKLGSTTFEVPPTTQFQMECGVKNSDAKYKVYTNSDMDVAYKSAINKLKEDHNKPVVAVLDPSTWSLRSYIYTEEQYIAGIDVPQLGYGGAHRNIKWIVEQLANHFSLITVGLANNKGARDALLEKPDRSFLEEASLIKNCDFFIGSLGGLSNVAVGVGTKTITNGDFIHQLYGWNGVIHKLKEPQIGGRFYQQVESNKHFESDPYLTDEGFYEYIKTTIESNCT